MMLRAITFDFWSTLVDGRVTPERTARRVARLHRAVVAAGHHCTLEEFQRARRQAFEQVDRQARASLRDVGPPGRWAAIAAALGVSEEVIPYEVVERAYEEITFDPVPDAMPYVHEAVRAVHAAGYRLGIICNTGMAGGHTLRRVLERHGLLDYFSAAVFSNEFGWSKPHPAIFARALAELGGARPDEALHVGDLEELDVEGARRAGWRAVLYAPDTVGTLHTRADLVARDWREFPELVQRLDGAGA